MRQVSILFFSAIVSLGLIPMQSIAFILGTLTDTPTEGAVTYVATSNDFADILTEDGINPDAGTDQGYQGNFWRLDARNLDPEPTEGTDTIKIEFTGIGVEAGKFGNDQFIYSGPNENRGEISFTTGDNPATPSRPIPEILSAGNVQLTWTNVSGVTYDVYRSTLASGANNGASNGRYERIATDTTSPYTDTGASTSDLTWYLLIAKGSRSGHSPEVVVASGSGNGGNVSLTSSGPPTWIYTLTHSSGKVTQWSYTGAGITDASVTGTAAAAGWFVLSQTATEVVFSAGVPLDSGSLAGFQIEGTQGGTGQWQAHDNSGNLDGSLPVELSAFTGAATPDGVRLRWRTESETNNLGFRVYRSANKEGQFEKVAFVYGHGNTPMPHDYTFTDEKVKVGETYYYFLEDIDLAGNTEPSGIITVTFHRILSKAVPTQFVLHQNFPNPFNPETWIPYELADDVRVEITIHNALGEHIRTLDLGVQPGGSYVTKEKAAYWNGQSDTGELVTSGVYFYDLKAGNFHATKKMIILR